MIYGDKLQLFPPISITSLEISMGGGNPKKLKVDQSYGLAISLLGADMQASTSAYHRDFHTAMFITP